MKSPAGTEDGGFGWYPHSINSNPNPYVPSVFLLRGTGGTTMRPIRMIAKFGKRKDEKAQASDPKSQKITNQPGSIDLNQPIKPTDGLKTGPSFREKERHMIEVRNANEKRKRDQATKTAQEERQKLKNRVMSASEKIIKPKYQPRRLEDVQKEQELKSKQLEEQKKQAKEWRSTHKREPIPPANPSMPPAPVEPIQKKETDLNFLDALDGGEKTLAEASQDSTADKAKKDPMQLRQERAVALGLSKGFKTGLPKRAVFASHAEVYSRTGAFMRPAKPGGFLLPLRPKNTRTSIWDCDLSALQTRDLSRPQKTRRPSSSASQTHHSGQMLDF